MQPLFRDVTDHVKTIQEQIDSLREVLAFAFEANLLVGQAQETAVFKKTRLLARDHCRAYRDRWNLRNELQKYARAAVGVWVLHCYGLYSSHKRYPILAFATRRMVVSCRVASRVTQNLIPLRGQQIG